jgi:ferritin
MLKEKVMNAINDQINAEFYSAYLYLSMAAWFENKGLSGFANWMRIQYQEETAHAMKFFDYVVERGGRVILTPIASVETDFISVVEIFEKALAHEEYITDRINKIMDVAIAESDYASRSFLDWFVDEQVEEEANVNEILDTLRLIDGKGNGLFMLDREMKQRVFVDSTKTE